MNAPVVISSLGAFGVRSGSTDRRATFSRDAFHRLGPS